MRDRDSGLTRHLDDRGNATRGVCDGWTSRFARRETPRMLSMATVSCAGMLAALPEDARVLVGARDDADHRGHTRLEVDLVTDLDRALIATGWESDSIRFVGFEEIRHDPYWRGPCGPLPDGGQGPTIATWGAGTLMLSPRLCD